MASASDRTLTRLARESDLDGQLGTQVDGRRRGAHAHGELGRWRSDGAQGLELHASEQRVHQRLFSSDAALGIDREQLLQEIELQVGGSGQARLERLHRLYWRVLEHLELLRRSNHAFPLDRARVSECV